MFEFGCLAFSVLGLIGYARELRAAARRAEGARQVARVRAAMWAA